MPAQKKKKRTHAHRATSRLDVADSQTLEKRKAKSAVSENRGVHSGGSWFISRTPLSPVPVGRKLGHSTVIRHSHFLAPVAKSSNTHRFPLAANVRSAPSVRFNLLRVKFYCRCPARQGREFRGNDTIRSVLSAFRTFTIA
jgi:hypothetical protein